LRAAASTLKCWGPAWAGVRFAAVLLLVLLLLAGCASKPAPAPVVLPPPPPMEMRVLPAATSIFPSSKQILFPPAPAIATGFLGEPTLVGDANGSLYLTFPGCPNPQGGQFKTCNNGPVFRSDDLAATWSYLNLANGSLAPKATDANGDAMVAIDGAGRLYASDLGDGIPVFGSADRGATWTPLTNVVPKGDGADRQWSWGGPAGMVVEAWMATSPERALAVSVSHDAGASWSKLQAFDASIGWVGPITGSPDGTDVWIPYTKPLDSDQLGPAGGEAMLADPKVELRLLRSADSGATWTIEKTGYVITKDPAKGQWPGTLMAPVVARTGDGTLVYAWSEERIDLAARAAGTQASVYSMASKDGGKTWTSPLLLSGTRTAVLPWIVGGAADRYAVAYYAADDVKVSNDYEGTWDVDLTVADAHTLAAGHVAGKVHTGGICAKGGVCGLTGSDRSLLDFIGGALLPEGRIAIAYCSSQGMPGPSTSGLLGSSGTSVHVAVSEHGVGLQ